MASQFDPDAAAAPGTGIFGLPDDAKAAKVLLIPVPFDATTSYRRGTADGPSIIREASAQVDLFDRRFGRVYERGLHMIDEPRAIRTLSVSAGRAAAPVIRAGGVPEKGAKARTLGAKVAVVDRACERVNEWVYDQVARAIKQGKTPGVVGGEHSVPFGAIEAITDACGPVGILHVDAHMDLRQAFEGFTWSHASIMYNVLTRIDGVRRLVQVGIRDFGEREMQMADEMGDRVRVHYDDVMSEQMMRGTTWPELCARIVGELPDQVYVSFDIDGLDPSLCPHTGTPVPGGLSYRQAMLLIDTLRQNGKRVVGFDLVEVAPGPKGSPEWDANVGARVLYSLCGLG